MRVEILKSFPKGKLSLFTPVFAGKLELFFNILKFLLFNQL